MSQHIEWSSTTDAAELIAEGEDWTDDYGQRLDPGNVGLYVGDGSGGTVVQGTRDEIAGWLRDALKLVTT